MAAGKKDNVNNLSINDDWTLAMIKEFIETLMDVTLCNDVTELKNHLILECVWKKVEKKLSISHDSLKHFWYKRLHLQLFSPEPIYFTDIKIKLIEYVHDKGITNNKDINWHNVTLRFDGFTTVYLYAIYANLIKLAKSKIDSTEIRVLIKFLYSKYIPYLIENPEDKILPRLVYDKGTLVHIDVDLQGEFSPQKVRSNSSTNKDK